jgi:hypothetical protein
MNLIHVIGQQDYARLLQAGMPETTQPVASESQIIMGVMISRVTFSVTPEVFDKYNLIYEQMPLIRS